MDPDALRARRRAIRRGLVRTVLLLTGVTAVFLLVPWKAVNLGDTLLITAVFLIGLAGAAALIVWQVIAYRDAKMSGSARLQGLLVALYVAVAHMPLWLNAAVILAFAFMVFVRIGYVYPTRTPALQRTTLVLMATTSWSTTFRARASARMQING